MDKAKEMEEERARKKAAGEGDDEETVELSKEERMGPGGLDPVDVFETLPEVMKEAFESQDVEQLKVKAHSSALVLACCSSFPLLNH